MEDWDRETKILSWQTFKTHTKNLEEKILSKQVVWSSAVAFALAVSLFLNVITPGAKRPDLQSSISNLKKEQKALFTSDKPEESMKRTPASSLKGALPEQEGLHPSDSISIQPKLDKYFKNTD